MDGSVGIHGAAGAVGSAAAFALALGGVVRRLVLADAAAARLACLEMDLDMLRAAVPRLEVEVGDADALSACDAVVACAGAPHRDGQPRTAFLADNAAILAPLADALAGPDARCRTVVLVSNPVDVLATWLQRRLGERTRVVGHTLNDTLRLRAAIARARGCAPADVEAWSAGEHGPHAVPLLSHAAVRGRRVTLTAAEREQVLAEVGGWYDRWQRLGTGRTTAWSSAWGVAALVRALSEGDPRVWPVSVRLRGDYGVDGVCLTVPAILRPGGDVHVLDWRIADEEREAIATAAGAIAAACEEIDLAGAEAVGGVA